MSSNVAYFSTWRPHGNRVSKTRFSNPYFTYQYHKSPKHIIAYQRRKEKKKKNQKNLGRRARPGLHAAWVAHSALPRSRAAWVAHDLGRVRPGPRVTPGSYATWVACCPSFAFFLLLFLLHFSIRLFVWLLRKS